MRHVLPVCGFFHHLRGLIMLILSTKLKNRFTSMHAVNLKNISINGDKRGCSGFISRNNAIVYVNTERFGSLGYMYRTVKHLKDYTGGVNHWAKDLDSLVNGVNALLRQQLNNQ
jgi:hypothetical protein